MTRSARTNAPTGEFALPDTVTPALPAAASFADLGLPLALLQTLTGHGVNHPFPIQAATLPNSLAGRDVLGRGAPARARLWLSAWRCSRGSRAGVRSPSSRSG